MFIRGSMQFERRDVRDLSQEKYDRLAEFINGGGTDLSLINNTTNLVYAFAGKVPPELEDSFCKCAIQIFYFNGMDMLEMGSLMFDEVQIKQDSSGPVSVKGFGSGKKVFEFYADDAMFDPLTNDIFR